MQGGTYEGNKKRILTAVFIAGLLLGIAGCSGSDGSGTAGESGAEPTASSALDEQPDGTMETRPVAFGLGKPESIPAEFEAVVEANREALQAYQKQTAADVGVFPTTSRTVLGHTIYVEQTRPANAYVFSGTELVEVAVNIDRNDPSCPLYHGDRIYEALGKAPGTLKTEDGVLILDESATWSEASQSGTQIEKVLVNGDEIDTLAVGETWGTGEALRLRALTGADTLAGIQELAAPISMSVAVGGTQYTPIGNFSSGDFVVGYDGTDTFVFLARSMMVPTGEGFVPDMDAYRALLSETYGAELAASGNGNSFTAMQAAVDEVIPIWNPQTGETEEVTVIYTGEDGYLTINVEALEAITGVKVLLSEDGKQANIVIDAQYNRQAGGTAAGLGKTALEAREDIQQAAKDYEVLVAMSQAAEEELRIQNEQYQKQLEEAARRQNESSGNGTSSSPSNGSGSVSDAPGGSVEGPGSSSSSGDENSAGGNSTGRTVEEPTSGHGYETSRRTNAVWDPALGGWTYVQSISGVKVLIYPDGGIEYMD